MGTMVGRALLVVALAHAACGGSESEAPVPEAEYAGEYAGPYDGSYTLEIEPRRALTDEPVRIRISGLRGGQLATLRATATDGQQTEWASVATFRADDAGWIEPERQAPIVGTYQGVDPRGLFWSMRPIRFAAARPERFSTEGLDHMVIRFSVEAAGATLASAEIQRLYPWAGNALRREELEVDGLVGTLWYPDSAQQLPAVLMLGGSGGTPQTTRAALLAARGYAVLDLRYFGTDPLPSWLVEIPLEYFARALEWLERHPATDPERLGMFGSSKGAEVALLLATIHPEIRAIALYLPSSVVWAGITIRSLSPGSSWSRAGEPVPYVPFTVTARVLWRSLGILLGRAAAVRGTYELGLADEAAVQRAVIPVEQIQGAILLVSGSDDQVWPSAVMAEVIVERLRAHDFPYPYQHLEFEGAGHGLGVPYFPRSLSKTSSWSGDSGRLIHGGSAQHDERASALGWAAMLQFFERQIGGAWQDAEEPHPARGPS